MRFLQLDFYYLSLFVISESKKGIVAFSRIISFQSNSITLTQRNLLDKEKKKDYRFNESNNLFKTEEEVVILFNKMTFEWTMQFKWGFDYFII